MFIHGGRNALVNYVIASYMLLVLSFTSETCYGSQASTLAHHIQLRVMLTFAVYITITDYPFRID